MSTRVLLLPICQIAAVANCFVATAASSSFDGVGPGKIPPSQAAELQLALQGFSDLRIVEASLGHPPPSTVPGSPVWIYYKLRVRRTFDYTRGYWQLEVTSGLLRDISKARRWPRVAGQSVTLDLPNGTERWDGGSIIGTAFRGETEHASEA